MKPEGTNPSPSAGASGRGLMRFPHCTWLSLSGRMARGVMWQSRDETPARMAQLRDGATFSFQKAVFVFHLWSRQHWCQGKEPTHFPSTDWYFFQKFMGHPLPKFGLIIQTPRVWIINNLSIINRKINEMVEPVKAAETWLIKTNIKHNKSK